MDTWIYLWMEYYSAKKRKDLLFYVAIWMNLTYDPKETRHKRLILNALFIWSSVTGKRNLWWQVKQRLLLGVLTVRKGMRRSLGGWQRFYLHLWVISRAPPYVKIPWVVHFRLIHFIVHMLWLNKKKMHPQKQIILIHEPGLSELVRFKSVSVSTELPKSSGRNFFSRKIFSRLLVWSLCVWPLGN